MAPGTSRSSSISWRPTRKCSARRCFFINYDENGGFFDHLVPPTPPQSRTHGLSTVETTNEIFPGDINHPEGPDGLGVRVPMIVVSPWSKGGWVNSQVFDHTSLIRFIEARFAEDSPDLIETNITPWRRAVTGDLTSAFDFARPNERQVILPGTDAYKPQDFVRHADDVPVPPTIQTLPGQEAGVRPARALPYALHAHGGVHAADGSFRIEFGNVGQAAAMFQVRSGNRADAPRTYTVEPSKVLSDSWAVTAIAASDYDLSVYGPNGFLRTFKGGVGRRRGNVDVRALYDEDDNGITLVLSNQGSREAEVTVLDKYTGKTLEQELESGESASKRWSLARTFGWYDFVITVDDDPGFEVRFAGHVETGNDSISDPAMGGLV
jgi:phospholipase C